MAKKIPPEIPADQIPTWRYRGGHMRPKLDPYLFTGMYHDTYYSSVTYYWDENTGLYREIGHVGNCWHCNRKLYWFTGNVLGVNTGGWVFSEHEKMPGMDAYGTWNFRSRVPRHIYPEEYDAVGEPVALCGWCYDRSDKMWVPGKRKVEKVHFRQVVAMMLMDKVFYGEGNTPWKKAGEPEVVVVQKVPEKVLDKFAELEQAFNMT